MGETTSQKQVDKLVGFFALVLVGLPLIFIPTNIDLSYALRTGFLIAMAMIVVGYPSLRQRLLVNLALLKPAQRSALVGIGILVLLSTLISKVSISTSIIGYHSDYLGLPFWLSCGVLAITIGPDIWQHLKRNTAAYLISAASLLSVITFAYSYSVVTDRLGGVFFLATNSGIWASIGIVLTYEQFIRASTLTTKTRWLILCMLNFIPVILSESRITFIVCLFYVALVTFRHGITIATKLPLLLGVAISVIIIRLLNSSQTTYHDVFSSTSYRIDLYIASIRLLAHNIIGVGPSAADTIINSAPHLSPALIKTLDSGYIFLYAHNLIIDIGLMFGAAAMVLFIYLICACIYRLYSARTQPDFGLIIAVSVVLFANAMVNVPNNVLTCLFAVVIVGILTIEPALAKQKPQVAKHPKKLDP